ncbi:non-ribosomal peptide synthetase [Paenibacillus glacialis]|uniref:Non-ribosomal peptide synthetase n=1 Tax=Paenibacillus glacialis TaxID=494026 RepID=A0A162MHD3_9BACL|nr:non-ribosomal peptide synthetase [Paenibacillus glacialis]OAB44753.1 hypothetical protein PGLA_04890 [Paenibacillus glacialis]
MLDKLSRNLLLNSGKLDKEKDFWLSKLGSDFRFSMFPADHPYPVVWSSQMDQKTGVLQEETCKKLLTVAKQSDHALYMMLVAGVKYLLSIYLQNPDVVVTMPVFKSNKETDSLINAVVTLRTQVDREVPFKQLLGQVKQTVTEANAHQNYPIDKLGELLKWSTDPQGSPHLHTCIMLDTIHDQRLIEDQPIDMIVKFGQSDGEIQVTISYNLILFEEHTIDSILNHLIAFLGLAMEQPSLPMDQLPLLTLKDQEDLAARLESATVRKAIAPVGTGASKLGFHPLMRRFVEQSLHKWVFDTDIDVNSCWELHEHLISDLYAMPGTAYLEMAAFAVKAYFKSEAVQLRDIQFHTPLIVDEGETRILRAVIQEEKGQVTFSVMSSTSVEGRPVENWILHASCLAVAVASSPIPKIQLDLLQQQCSAKELRLNKGQQDANTVGFGPRWQSIQHYRYGNEQALVSMALDSEFSSDLYHYLLHPALLDLATSSYVEDGQLYMPLYYKKVTVYAPLTAKCHSFLKVKNDWKQANELLEYNIDIMDDSGNVLVKIEDFTLRRIHNLDSTLKALSGKNTVFHQMGWVNEEIETNVELPVNGPILIFRLETGIGAEMVKACKERGKDIIEVVWGDRYSQASENLFTISGSKDDYEKVLAVCEGRGIAHIWHFLTSSTPMDNDSVTSLEQAQDKGVRSLFHLARAIGSLKNARTIRLALITNQAMEVTGTENGLSPEHASLIGLGKVLGEEMPTLRCRGIDLDDQSPIDQLWRELQSDNDGLFVAYRNLKRYVVELQKRDEEIIGLNKIDIAQNGVYMITGGSGGLGLEMANYLARQRQVNLVLIGRSKFPERDQWEQMLNGDDARIIAKIQALLAIEQTSSSVIYFDADVADTIRMQEIVTNVKERFGAITGVIHAAGIAGEGFMAGKDAQAFQEVIRPKITGTYVLDQVTKAENLDFFVMFSSINTLAGAAGQSDYTAANSYLDAYAAYRSRKGKRTLTLNWTGWKETGMAVDFHTKELFFKDISTKDALIAFERALNSKETNLVIGQLNMNHPLFDEPHLLPLQLSTDLLQDIAAVKGMSSRHSNTQTDVEHTTVTSNATNETERQLALIWGQMLGLNEIDIDDEFTQLGGHSLNAITMTKKILSDMQVEISLSAVFQYPTIKELAQHLIGSEKSEYTAIQPAPVQPWYPLSSAQKRLFVVHQLEGSSLSYNMPDVMFIEGSLSRARFEEAFRKLIARHDTLRTSFEIVDDSPVQRIHPEVSFTVEYVQASLDEVEETIRSFVREFDLQLAPLLRVGLIQIDTDRHILLFDTHHIISDGASVMIMMAEFVKLYNGVEDVPLRIQYKDYAVWQQQEMKSEQMKKQEAYWLEAFRTGGPVLDLPTDYARPAVRSFQGETIEFVISSQRAEGLKQLAAQTGSTLFMALLAVYKTLLFKYSGQEDIVVGTPIEGRSQADLEPMIGMFVNTLAIRNQPSAEKSFIAFLQEMKATALQAYENQDYPFEELVNKLNMKRDLSRNPLFDTMFILQNSDQQELSIDGLRVKSYPYKYTEAKFDLTFNAMDKPEGILCSIEYASDLYNRNTIERMAKHIQQLIDAVVNDPQAPLIALEMITPEEGLQICDDFNDTEVEYLREKTIHQLFEEQVERWPNQTALVFENEGMTYLELNEKANQLARKLRSVGVEPDQLVGIMVERSFEMMIAILGVLKAGGAYVPIDPEYPEDRIRYMLEDSGTQLLLVQRHVKDRVSFAGEIIDMNESQMYHWENSNLDPIATSNHLAYVIYTSGSTGKPKGVMIEHHSVVNILDQLEQAYPLGKDDAFLLKTTYTFDVSVSELFGWFVGQGKLVILTQGDEKDPAAFLKVIDEQQITHINFVPSMLNVFLNALQEDDSEKLKSLKYIMACGEALSASLVDLYHRLPLQAKLENIYGPTEATIYATRYSTGVSTHSANVPIGQPMGNLQMWIVDSANHIQPIGIAGELCISGVGLARGYINRAELTAEKFVAHPFFHGERMYRTGDLVRWLPDGNIEYLGRIDHQVKLRGYRIELGEVESQLLSLISLQEAVVIAREDDSGQKQLCAYFVAAREITANELRNALGKELPNYMIPSYFVQLQAMPLTTNGKLDRKALPAPEGSVQTGTDYVAPRTDTENQLAQLWQEVLGLQQIGVHDNFFDIGGHSMRATMLVAKIHKEMAINLPLKVVFQSPTIEQMAQIIIDTEQDELASVPIQFMIPVQPQFRDSLSCTEMEIASLAGWLKRDFEFMFANSWNFAYDSSLSDQVSECLSTDLVYDYILLEEYHGMSFEEKKLLTNKEILADIVKDLSQGKPILVILKASAIPWDGGYLNPNNERYHVATITGITEDHQTLICTDSWYNKYAIRLSVTDFQKAYSTHYSLELTREESLFTNWQTIVQKHVLTIRNDVNPFQQMRDFALAVRNHTDLVGELRGHKSWADAPLSKTIINISIGRILFSNILKLLIKKNNIWLLEQIIEKLEEASYQWRSVNKIIANEFMIPSKINYSSILSNKIEEIASLEEAISEQLLEICRSYEELNTAEREIAVTQIMDESLETEQFEYECLNIEASFNNQGFGKIGSKQANLTTMGTYFLIEQAPETVLHVNEIQYQLPHIQEGTKDNISCYGQTIPVPEGMYSEISFLGCAEWGNYIEQCFIEYADGSIEAFQIRFTDWTRPPQFGEAIAWTGQIAERNEIRTFIVEARGSIYQQRYSLTPFKPMVAIRLPYSPGMHIFSITLKRVN